jgi:acetyl-CoA carboxylase biotin carboxylase subunit
MGWRAAQGRQGAVRAAGNVWAAGAGPGALPAPGPGRRGRSRGERGVGPDPAGRAVRFPRTASGPETMYGKILIANRGEIAVRVIRACHELGITAVAVYSEADRDALHVHMADQAECIGAAPATQSYLNVPAILAAAARTHADAIHPGYGFLAENSHFAAVCKTWGLDFIGPEPETIAQMGSKTAARQRMAQVGVPVVPGTPAACDEAQALAAAAEIGYPVLVKAAAGGGGRGLRVARSPQELRQVFAAAGREAAAAFGSGELYVERLLERPRHVEFQVLADRHGHVVHLCERDSSIQRRRQKILEEALAPTLTPALRSQMARAALEVAQAVHYIGAGTVEFLVDTQGHFYFIEMNTRIQVEHPTTEMVTGIDLVKEQIRVAAGERLSVSQQEIVPNGWAIECRINAEDPRNRFTPSPGTIALWRPPSGPWVRVDDGVYSGYTVPAAYDSLLCKVIVWGRDRAEALARSRAALDDFAADGICTTLHLHRWLLRDPEFTAGRYHTGWLEDNLHRFQQARAANEA